MRREKAVLYKIRVTAFPRFHTLFHLVIVNSYEQILLEYKNVRKITNTQFFRRKCFPPKMQTPSKEDTPVPQAQRHRSQAGRDAASIFGGEVKEQNKRGFLWTFGASTGS